MKKLCLTLLMCVTLQGFCPNTVKNHYETIKKEVYTEEYLKKLDILNTIISIEKPKTKLQALEALKRENAEGILQIRPIAIKEVNRILKENKYTLIDRQDSIKSIEIFFIIQNYWNPEWDPKKACFIWCGGSSYHKLGEKGKEHLNNYWNKFITLKK